MFGLFFKHLVMTSLPFIFAGSCDHSWKSVILLILKLIQFANRSKLENAGLISSLPKLVFELLQSSHKVFCSHVQLFVSSVLRKLQQKWEILIPTSMQMPNWGWHGWSSLLMFNWCSWEENRAVLFWPQPCSMPHCWDQKIVSLCFSYSLKRKKPLEYQQSLAQRQHVS